MSDSVQQIKERLSIVTIVGEYVRLTKAGKNYKGLSPFKKEKTPSFYVSPDKGMYYDFSSGRGGDIFSFVQEIEGLDFKGALRMLAERAGVELVHEDKSVRDERERMYDVLERACRFFETKLSEEPLAQRYLVERGLEETTSRSFRVGFAPAEWESLLTYLTGEGFSIDLLDHAGLIKKGERGKWYDRFRSRIMFPIMDPSGRVIAFTGRIFGEAGNDEKNAKYLNSPETPLYDKGRTLYGYHKAKQSIRKYDFSILVEGQMDLILCHQAGYPNTVAVSGTGLTDEHLGLLDRLSKNIVLALDADSAGVASTARSATLALKRGMDVKVVQVPLGKDPADCILENVDLWKGAVRDAQHVVDFFFSVSIREHHGSANGDGRTLTLAVRDTVLPFVALIPSGVDQAHFVRTIASRLDIAEDAVWQDVRAVRKDVPHRDEVPVRSLPTVEVREVRERVRTRKENLERVLAGFLFWQETLDPREITDEDVHHEVSKYSVSLAPLLARYDAERNSLIFQEEVLGGEAPQSALERLRTHLQDIAREDLKAERSSISHELRIAEHERNEDRVAELLHAFQNVSAQIEKLDREG
jgi:DNA primase